MRTIFDTILRLLLSRASTQKDVTATHVPVTDVTVTRARVTKNHAQKGEAFSARLKALTFSQNDFASICGVSKRTVTSWATGRHRVSPAALTLLAILEKKQARVVKPPKAPRGRPFEPGNPYRFGDKRRTNDPDAETEAA